MLTFADDGLVTAECIAKIFRSKQPRIGVLILQEQEKGVYSRAEEFIDDCFKQVAHNLFSINLKLNIKNNLIYFLILLLLVLINLNIN